MWIIRLIKGDEYLICIGSKVRRHTNHRSKSTSVLDDLLRCGQEIEFMSPVHPISIFPDFL
ncbi:unnamed protein product [Arabidopsis halleri]